MTTGSKQLIMRETARELIIYHDERIVALKVPHKTFMASDGTLVMRIPHTLDAARLLRNLGYDAPSPLVRPSEYDWASQRPFASQVDTAARLLLNPRMFILSEMGVGKTLAVLFAFDYLRKLGAVKRMLVVAPKSTLTTVWEQEIFRRLPHLEATVLYGDREKRLKLLNQPADIYIINHDGLKVFCPKRKRNNYSSFVLGKELAARTDIDVVVLDELAIYRNASTDRWKTAKELVAGRKYVWGLTGSPIPKSPTDAFAQVRLLNPIRVAGMSFTSFREDTMYPQGPFKWLPRRDALTKVYEIMQPAVRYTRDECFDLPETTYSYRNSALSASQKEAYKQMAQKMVIEHQGQRIVALNAGVQYMKLLEILTGFVFDAAGNIVHLDAKPRLDVLDEIIEESEGKVIVFTPFKPSVSIIADHLRKQGAAVAQVTGDTSLADRTKIFTGLQHGLTPRVLVAHPKAMSHGLTLTAASTIVWFAPLPDLEIYEQANARITRPGQKLHTHIVHIVSTPTESKVAKTLQTRGNLQQVLLEMFVSKKRA